MRNVVVTDFTFPDLDIERAILASEGCGLISGQCKTLEKLIPLVVDADAVITQFATVSREVIGAMRKARVIVRYGIGVDNVDLEAARERGIPVCNVPDYCIDEVADHTLAFILAAMRQVVPHTNGVRAGAWKLAVPLDAMRALRDQTVGVVGFGRIGREVVRRLAPFKCRILVHDPFAGKPDIESAGALPADLTQLWRESDVITLHCPSTPQTRGLIQRSSIAQMKRGVLLVNLARGDLVDPAALVEALEEGKIAGAALDVFSPEPIPPGHPILRLENVILAPHIASASVKAVRKLRETAAGIALRCLRGELLPNVVNGVAQPGHCG